MSGLTGVESIAAAYEVTQYYSVVNLYDRNPADILAGLFITVHNAHYVCLGTCEADYPIILIVLHCSVPGTINVHGAPIQILDLPGIIEGAKDGRGRGRQVIAGPSQNFPLHHFFRF